MKKSELLNSPSLVIRDKMASSESNAKKPKLDSNSPFATQNRYEVLAVENEDMIDVSNRPTEVSNSKKSDKPPPIYICNVVDMNKLLLALNDLKVDCYKHKTISDNKVKLNVETIDAYRSVTSYLQSMKAEFYSYQLKSDKNFRVVIRGLHPSCDVNLVMNELTEMGFQPVQMIPVHHPVTKVPLPLFFLDLKQNVINDKIYEVNRLYYAVVKIEPPRPKRTIIQCANCQDYGHSKNYCHRKSRCVKCDGFHLTSKCTKNPTAPPICTNCKGQHTANYRGCPVHIGLQNASQRENKKNTNAYTTTNYNASRNDTNSFKTNQTTHDSSHTYADATKCNATSSENNFTAVINKLIDKIDNIVSLLVPLINTLTQVLPVLVNKK